MTMSGNGFQRRPIECVALVSSAATQLALIACDKRQQQAQDTGHGTWDTQDGQDDQDTNANDDGMGGRKQEAGGHEDSAPDAAANFCRFFNFNFSLKCPWFPLVFSPWDYPRLLCLHLKQLAR